MNAPEPTRSEQELEQFRSEICSYVGFGQADSDRLAALLAPLEPRFPAFSAHFYECITRHPEARRAITGGDVQVERLKATLVRWMRSGLAGPHDGAFFEGRRRIGERHVRIGLAQRYMFTAMNVMREDFHFALDDHLAPSAATQASHRSVDRLFDLELAIMLESYAERRTEQLEAAQRMSVIGQLASGIGHELRNPIGVISSSVFLVARRLPPDDKLQRHLKKMQRSVSACESIISNLMDLARDRALAAESIDLAKLIAAVVSDHELLANAHIECSDGCKATLNADPGLLERLLGNLLVNAAQAAAPEPARVHVRTFVEEGSCVLQVRDSGPGFPPALLDKVFEPLVSQRHAGTGLGLALVQRIAERHGGRARARNAERGGGAIVEVFFPLAPSDAAQTRPSA